MNYKNQLERMVATGTLSKEQSERLQSSLQSQSKNHLNYPKRHISVAVMFTVLMVLLVLSFLIFTGNDSAVDQVNVEDIRQTLNQPGDIGAMNSITSSILAVALFLIIPILLFVFTYNNIVGKEEEVRKSWAQVESNYQRRSDLIPNLIETVSKYMRHESSTLENVIGKRSQDVDDMVEALVKAQSEGSQLLRDSAGIPTDEGYLASVETTQQRVGSIMSRLLATVEAYPELSSSEQMMELQAQLEGTENRINIARINFNETVATFNRSIRVLPGSLIASLGNFKRKAYFQSQDGASESTKISFD